MKRIVVLVLLLSASACSSANDPVPEASPVQRDSIDATLERHAERLMAIDGIQGIAVGETEAGDPCLLILATVPADDLAGVVGDSLDGWPIRIESGDEIRPLD